MNPTNEVRPVIGVNLKVLLQIPPNDDDNQHVYELTLLNTHNSQIRVFNSDADYQKFIKEEGKSELSSYSFTYRQVQKVDLSA